MARSREARELAASRGVEQSWLTRRTVTNEAEEQRSLGDARSRWLGQREKQRSTGTAAAVTWEEGEEKLG